MVDNAVLSRTTDGLAVEHHPERGSWRVAGWMVPALTLVAAVAGLLAPLRYLMIHATDQAGTDHTASVWLALTAWAHQGTLIPPLESGGSFGGTRYMPLPIELSSLLSSLLGDGDFRSDVLAGRLLSFGGGICVGLVAYAGARRFGVSRWICVALATAVVSTPVIGDQLRGIRADALPAAVSVLALVLVTRRTQDDDGGLLPARRLALAGALCALAPMLKISELWPLAAIGLFLLWRARTHRSVRELAPFVGTFSVVLVAGLAWAQLATDGRMVENLSALLVSGEDSVFWVYWNARRFLVGGVPAWGLLLIPALVGLLDTALARRGVDLWRLALVTCCLVTAVVWADRGVEFNHLIDLVLVTVLCAARTLAELGRAAEDRRMGLVLVVTTLLMVAIPWWKSVPDLLRGTTQPFYSVPASLSGAGQVFTEDVSVSLASDQLPPVLDAFSFRRLAIADPTLQDRLVDRIDAHDYPAVLLLADVPYEEPSWYDEKSLGRGVADAICTAYQSDGLVADGRYELFLPAEGTVDNSGTVCDPSPRAKEK